jgi:hypothetical protein
MWDRSEHIMTGVVPGGEDFLWPPHILIYVSFLLSLLVAFAGTLFIARPYRRLKIYDPRVWVRNQPYIGAIAIAAFYGIGSIPGDAIWHELYGIDLTAWSPPHILIATASIVEGFCAAGLLIQSRPVHNRFDWRDLAIPLIIGFSLNMALLTGVTEWEAARPFRSDTTAGFRPIWYYPVTSAFIMFTGMLIARKIGSTRWGATFTALATLAIRGLISGFLSSVGGESPEFPLNFLLGALVIDLLPWERVQHGFLRYFSLSLAFSTGFYLLAIPVLADTTRNFQFQASDYVSGILATLVLGVLVAPAAVKFGHWFGQFKPQAGRAQP